jgi:uncharacterized membrane protein YqaE (UPF0057 family)
MRFALCILFPPLAVLLTGKPISALFNAVLTLCFWVPGVIHAFFVVNDFKNEQRLRRLEQRGIVATKAN